MFDGTRQRSPAVEYPETRPILPPYSTIMALLRYPEAELREPDLHQTQILRNVMQSCCTRKSGRGSFMSGRLCYLTTRLCSSSHH